jgi:PAS domain S-box-containing protein
MRAGPEKTEPPLLSALPALRLGGDLSLRYLVAVGVVGVALAVRLALATFFDPGLTYITFSPAVMVVATICGRWPGLAATALSMIVAWAFVICPGALRIPSAPEAVGLALFGAMGILMSLVASLYHEARHRLLSAEKDLAAKALEEQLVARLTALSEREALARAQLEAAFQAVQDGVMVFDMAGQAVLVNKAEARINGYPDAESMRRDLAHFAQVYELFELDGQALPVEQWPVSRVLRGETIPEVELRGRRRDTGQAWVFSFSGAPVLDGHGRQVLAVTITRDITRRRMAEEALREADRRKNEFLAMLSHELRAPLAPIRARLDMLTQSGAEGAPARAALEVVDRQTNHLSKLVDDLLDSTRISQGKINLSREVVDGARIVQRTAADLQPLFDRRAIQLSTEVPVEPAWLDVDPTRLIQIVGNLLQNAAKFTAERGHVRLLLAVVGAEVVLTVSDDGPGIRPDVLARVFEPFMQDERTLARTHGGLGLGLALVKGLVELHGGTVRAHSEGPGRGATFEVRLALADAPAAQAAPPSPSARTGARALLVVDDNVDAATSLAELLRLHGYQVEVAFDGHSGVSAAKALRPEVVICDIGLPDLDGYQVARTLRGVEALRPLRLIALSGYAQPSDRALALEAGFDAHLPKPAPVAELLEVVGRAS